MEPKFYVGQEVKCSYSIFDKNEILTVVDISFADSQDINTGTIFHHINYLLKNNSGQTDRVNENYIEAVK